MKILMAFADYTHTPERKRLNTYGALGYYRIIKPYEGMKRLGYEVDLVGKEIAHFGTNLETQWEEVFKKYDVFWTNYISDAATCAAILFNAQKSQKKIVIDIDDNFLDVPPSNLLYQKYKPGKKDRAYLCAFLSMVDVLTVSTEPLRDRLSLYLKSIYGIEKPIIIIPNMNDAKDWDYKPALKHNDRTIIGYSGSHSHKDDLQLVMPVIAKLMNKNQSLHFEIMGAVAKNEIKNYFGGFGFTDSSLNRIGMLPATETFKEYPKWLSEQRWDIGIAPLIDTPFTRSKSHIKWMEYAMFKIPCVASRVYPYFMESAGRETIKDGETGLLAKPKEWEVKLNQLIENKILREKLGDTAFSFVKENWQYDLTQPLNKLVSVLDTKNP